MKLSDIFSFAEWTKRVLSGFVYNVCIKLISYNEFTCATNDFQKSRKTAIFENCVKNVSFEKKIKCLMFFKITRPVCIRLYFDLIKYFSPKPFIFKNVVFAFLTKKNKEVKENFSKNTTKLLSM